MTGVLSAGDVAPDFTLPGYYAGEFDTYSLADASAAGKRVLLTFYPGDFSPICSQQLCEYRDADWYTYKTDLQIYGISRDTVFSHKKFAEQNNLNHPLLSDVPGDVCQEYDALVDEFEGMESVPRRSVFLVDSDQTIRYVWRTDDNWERPDINHIREAVKKI